jgi:HPt (histidine-containing phosphotransfer) domain-containing protein
MDDYVSKPIRVEALVGALSKVRPLEERGSGPSASGEEAEENGSGEAKDMVNGGAEELNGEAEQTVNHQVLDPAALETLLEVVGGETALLGELIDSFLEEAPPLVANLRQALEGEDAAELRRAAHTIKSSSHDFGATNLAELCQELENMGKADTLDGAAELVAQVEGEYEQVRVALEAARRGL